jgi:hypothetical protein
MAEARPSQAIEKAPAKAVDKPADKNADTPEAPRGWLSWLVGWVLVPGVVVGLIWFGGVMLGAHNHDGWFTRSVVWLVDLF